MIVGAIPREVWEEPGYTIAEHTSSGPQPWRVAQYVALHYTAREETPADYEGVKQHIRNSQRYYCDQRGYSLGYNWTVDRTGRIWEIRGADYECAANGNSTTNRGGPAILCLVNGNDGANAPMIAAVRRIIATCGTAAGHVLDVVPHSALRPTLCPGTGLTAQIADGTFTNPMEQQMVEYIATPPARYRNPHRGAFYVCGGAVRYCTTPDTEYAAKHGIEKLELSDDQYANLYRNVFGEQP